MPNAVTHQHFGNQVMKQFEELKTLLKKEWKVFDFATMGPDVMYGLKLSGDAVKGHWGEYVHAHFIKEQFMRAARTLKETERDKLWLRRYAYALGNLTHYILDSRMHSYVYHYQYKRLPGKVPEDYNEDIHMLIETCLDYHVLTNYEKGSNKERIYKRFQWNGRAAKAMQDYYNYALGDLFDFNMTAFDRIFTTNVTRLVLFLEHKGGRFKFKFTRFLENKTGFNHLLTAGYRVGLGSADWDILNLNRVPFDRVTGGKDAPSTETFDEVFARALQDGAQYVNAFWTAVNGDLSALEQLDFSIDYDAYPAKD